MESKSYSSHPLHRGCGLKLKNFDIYPKGFSSPSSQRVWIEIYFFCLPPATNLASPSSQRVWIEICKSQLYASWPWSPSSQRVWIEIINRFCVVAGYFVTLFTEGVDWNKKFLWRVSVSVCHPLHRGCGLKSNVVLPIVKIIKSPSSQRVWIEIIPSYSLFN